MNLVTAYNKILSNKDANTLITEASFDNGNNDNDNNNGKNELKALKDLYSEIDETKLMEILNKEDKTIIKNRIIKYLYITVIDELANDWLNYWNEQVYYLKINDNRNKGLKTEQLADLIFSFSYSQLKKLNDIFLLSISKINSNPDLLKQYETISEYFKKSDSNMENDKKREIANVFAEICIFLKNGKNGINNINTMVGGAGDVSPLDLAKFLNVYMIFPESINNNNNNTNNIIAPTSFEIKGSPTTDQLKSGNIGIGSGITQPTTTSEPEPVPVLIDVPVPNSEPNKSQIEKGKKIDKVPNSLIIFIKTRIPSYSHLNFEPYMSVPKSKSHTVYFDPLI
jgi:hypothetical protein